MAYYLQNTTFDNSWINRPDLFILKGTSYLEQPLNFNYTDNNFSINHEELYNLYQNPLNIFWSKPSDIISNRFKISIQDSRTTLESSPLVSVTLGCRGDLFTEYTTHSVSAITLPESFFIPEDEYGLKPQIILTIDSNSISILFSKYENKYFFHVGYLEPNTEFNYYSSPTLNTCYIIASDGENSFIKHFVNNESKFVYGGEEATYPIICELGGKPKRKWLTNLVFYDNNELLGYPYIGIPKNLVCSTSDYEIGRPVYLLSEDKFYLPSFKFLNKTIMFNINV